MISININLMLIHAEEIECPVLNIKLMWERIPTCETRMHSSGMRTVRFSGRILREGGTACLPRGGVSTQGGCLPGGSLPDSHPHPCEQNDIQV